MEQLSAPPPGVLVELTQLQYPLRHRIAEDGRYLLTSPGEEEHEEQIEVAWGKYQDALPEEVLQQLRDAIAACDFFSLPPELPTPAVRTAPLGGALQREPLAFGARLGDRAHAVRIEADPRAPASAGALEPVLAVLWHELLSKP